MLRPYDNYLYNMLSVVTQRVESPDVFHIYEKEMPNVRKIN